MMTLYLLYQNIHCNTRVHDSSYNRLQYRALLIHVFTLCLCAGGVGFDINCGVRLIRTNLMEKDVQPVKEQLAQVSTQRGGSFPTVCLTYSIWLREIIRCCQL